MKNGIILMRLVRCNNLIWRTKYHSFRQNVKPTCELPLSAPNGREPVAQIFAFFMELDHMGVD